MQSMNSCRFLTHRHDIRQTLCWRQFPCGLGDACADESFYGQFVGKTQENYTDIDAISGATLTTNGYTQAIERAFNAVITLNGGAK